MPSLRCDRTQSSQGIEGKTELKQLLLFHFLLPSCGCSSQTIPSAAGLCLSQCQALLCCHCSGSCPWKAESKRLQSHRCHPRPQSPEQQQTTGLKPCKCSRGTASPTQPGLSNPHVWELPCKAKVAQSSSPAPFSTFQMTCAAQGDTGKGADGTKVGGAADTPKAERPCRQI